MIALTDDQIESIYDVLVRVCGATDTASERLGFGMHFPTCGEWRFQGDLGFGGKVYCDGFQVWVSCYREDATPGRRATIARANAALAAVIGHAPRRP